MGAAAAQPLPFPAPPQPSAPAPSAPQLEHERYQQMLKLHDAQARMLPAPQGMSGAYQHLLNGSGLPLGPTPFLQQQVARMLASPSPFLGQQPMAPCPSVYQPLDAGFAPAEQYR